MMEYKVRVNYLNGTSGIIECSSKEHQLKVIELAFF